MKTFAIGVDFGGTNTKLGLIDCHGAMVRESTFPTATYAQPVAFAKKLAQEIDGLLAHRHLVRKDLAGVGIGVPGLVDPIAGKIHTLVNVRGWDGEMAGRLFSRILRMPARLENDVNAMALGEMQYGAARGYNDVVCVTLGTGVGGGLILNGRLHRGATLTAGEIGHIVVNSSGPRCNCGNRGCLEALVGTKGLLQRARAALKRRSHGVLKDWVDEGKELSPHLLALAARKKDATALQVWDQTALYLGTVFAGIANLLNPELIVLGGGIAAAGDFFLNKIRSVTKAQAMSVPAAKLKIVRSALGNRAGMIGAASLIFVKGERP